MVKFVLKKSSFFLYLNVFGILLLLGSLIYAPNLWFVAIINLLGGFALYLNFFSRDDRSFIEVFFISLILGSFPILFIQALNVFKIPITFMLVFSFMILLPLALILLKYKKVVSNFKNFDLKKTPDVFCFGVIVVLSLFFFNVFVTGDILPQEDGPLLSYIGLKVEQDILEHRTIYHWNEEFFAGSPQIPMESAVTYYRMGLTSLVNIFNGDFYKDVANLQLLFGMFLMLSLYLIFRGAKIDPFVALFGVILFFLSEIHTDATHANIRLIFPAIFVALIIYFMVRIIDGKKDYTLLILTASVALFHHVIYGLGALLFVGLFLAIYFAIKHGSLLKNLTKGKTLKKNIPLIVLFGVLSLGIMAFYLYNVSFLPYEIKEGTTYENSSHSPFSATFNTFKFILGMSINKTLIFQLLMLLAIVYLFVSNFRKHSKVQFTTFLSLILVVLAYVFLYNFFMVNSSTFSGISAGRRVFYFLFPVVAIGVLYALQDLIRKNRTIFFGLASILVLIFLFPGKVASYSESVMKPMSSDHRALLPGDFENSLDASDNNRFVLYCMNYFAKAPEVLKRTELSSMENSIGEMENLAAWRLKYMNPGRSNRILPRLDHTPQYWSNFMRITNTNYAFVNFCGCPDLASFFPPQTTIAFDSQCIKVLEVGNGAFAEKVELSYPAQGIYDGADYSINNVEDNPLYDSIHGYKHHFPKDFESFDGAGSVKIINDEPDLAAISEPIPLTTTKISDEEYLISGDFAEGDFIFVKYNYFPLWKAYQGNQELRIFESNVDLTLIEAKNSGDIHLVYDPEPTNKMLYAVFVISFILVLFFNRRFENSVSELLEEDHASSSNEE